MRSAATLFVAIAILAAAIVGGCSKPAPTATAPVAPKAAAPKAEATAPESAKLILFAGTASKPALEELAKTYEQQNGVKVDASYGGSGALLTQITTEHYGDLYIPGSDDFMDKAEAKAAVDKQTRTVMAYLVPTILVAKGNPKKVTGLKDLARADVRVVLAQSKSVCLGDVSEEILQKAKLLDKVKPKVASFASSCEETLNMLLLGEADAIIAWDAYARQQPEKVESVPLPKELVRARNIPGAVITWSKQPEAGKKFLAYLASDEAKAVLKKHGYVVEKP
jgi:molybdate transport system substrate-binding protein